MYSTLRRLPAFAKAASSAFAPVIDAPQVSKAASTFFARSIHSASITREIALPGHDNATGMQRDELEFEAEKGISPFAEEWATAPFGTLESPKVVPSYYSERIVGVVDPDDDSLVLWATVKEGEPPMQIIEGGEYFVLKKIPGGPAH